MIDVASTAIVHPVDGAGLYTAVKAPGRYFADVLARELAARHVTVNTIMPGQVGRHHLREGGFGSGDEPAGHRGA